MGKRHQTDRSDPTDLSDPQPYAAWLDHNDPAVVANAVICLIHQANYLLDRQIAGLERQFIQEGGYSENLAAARRAARQRQDPTELSDPTDQSDRINKTVPSCPLCGKAMALRIARQGKNAGSRFWGCRAFPECRGTRPMEEADRSDGSDRSVERKT